jgi:hypothetical protein
MTVFLSAMAALAAAPPGGAGRLQAPNLADLAAASSVDALAGSLRGYLVRSLPEPLYEVAPGWGHTARVVRGLRWTGKNLPLQPEVVHGEKKQGTWRKMRITADKPADTLVFDLRDVRTLEEGRIGFTAFISLEARLDYCRQQWAAGVKLLDSSVRARMHLQLTLDCDATTRLEPSVLLVPDAVFTLHVLRSELKVDHVVVEHVAGVGGEAAKLLGDVFKGSLRELHPSLERDLLAKANAAVVKAGQAKEVRISLLRLLKAKPAAAPPVTH